MSKNIQNVFEHFVKRLYLTKQVANCQNLGKIVAKAFNHIGKCLQFVSRPNLVQRGAY